MLYDVKLFNGLKKRDKLAVKKDYYLYTVVCKIVHKFASVWCKTALGEVGMSLP